MNRKYCWLVVFLFLLAGCLPATAQPRRQKPKKPVPAPSRQAAKSENEAMLDLLRRAEESAKQAQQEARLAREQQAELLRRLAQNTEELSSLRQTIQGLGAQLAELKIDRKEVAPQSTVSEAKTEKPLPSPDPASTPTNSEPLQTELDLLKEQIDLNTAQIKEQAQTKVESDSKFRIKLSGMILANAFLNTNDSSLNDVPLFAPLPTTAPRKNNVGASLRQTRIGFIFEGPNLSQRLGNARLSAEAEFDFWGGETTEVLGSLRILTASARLDWAKTSLIVGQRQPMISPRNPTSLAATWFSPLTGAGNLWQWRPQLMLEHRIRAGEATEVQVQGGLLMPFGETVQGGTIEGGPGYESRVVWSRSLDTEQKIEFGFGGYFHRRPFSFNRAVNSRALTGDWQVPLTQKLSLSGEVYAGRAINLGEASGFRNDRLFVVSGLLSNPATSIRGVFSTGGWAQLSYKVKQVTPSTRLKNQAAFANFIWALRQNFLVSLEYRRLWTDYQNSRQRAGHYNLAFGYTF